MGIPRLRLLHLPALNATAHQAPDLSRVLTRLDQRRPDLILCCGLTTDATVEAFNHALRALMSLTEALNLAPSRLYLTPGPGDCDVDALGPTRSLFTILQATEVFAHTRTVGQLLGGFEQFCILHKGLVQGGYSPAMPYSGRQTLHAHLKIEVLGLNSAWADTEHQVVGASAVLQHAPSFASGDVRIVQAYHPVDAWQPDEAAALQPLLQQADLVLHAPPTAQWIEVHTAAIKTGPLDGRLTTRPLGRSLPTPDTPMVSADAQPRDLGAYLDWVEREWCQLSFAGLVDRKEEVAPQAVHSVYVSLRCAGRSWRDRMATELGRQPKLADMMRFARLPDEDAEEPESIASRLLEAEPDEQPDMVKALLDAMGLPTDERTVTHAVRRVRAMQPGDDQVPDVLGLWELEQAVADAETLLIEGGPGSGKTTTLQAVAASLVQAHRGEPEQARAFGLQAPWPIPIFVPFRAFWYWLDEQTGVTASGAELLVQYLTDYVAHHAQGADWLRPALESGSVMLLLDGLDELPGGMQRKAAIKAARECAQTFKQCRIIITSRPAGMDHFARTALHGIDDLHQVTVRPLDPDQIRAFLRTWYARLLPESKAPTDRLLSELEARGWLTDPDSLATTPITLMVLAIVALRGPLPAHRAALYDACVEVLCERWEWKTKQETWRFLKGDLSLEQKRRVLQRLAYLAFSEKAERIERGPLLDAVQAALGNDSRAYCEKVVDHLAERSGILVPDAGRYWRFRHRTFVEYLAARQLCDVEEHPEDKLADRLTDPAWHEVTLLAIAHTAQDYSARATAMLEHLFNKADAQRDPTTSVEAHARIAESVIDLHHYGTPLAPIAERFATRWAQLVEDPTTPGSLKARMMVGDALGWLGDPRLGWTDAHFADVPAGTVFDGAVRDDVKDSELHLPPRPDVPVAAFQIGRYLVTVGQFLAFIDDGGLRDPRWWPEPRASTFDLTAYLRDQPPNSPASMITWHEANAFCDWATAKYGGSLFRLPTSAEWSRAARGDDRRLYPWGDEEPTPGYANYDELNLQRSSAVGLFSAGRGPYGAADQAGNVLEWCADTIVWVDGENLRVLRGGAFSFDPPFLRVSLRDGFLPDGRNDIVGFRCVRVCPETA